MSGVRRLNLDENYTELQEDGAQWVAAPDFDTLAAENARLERDLADARKKSSARKLALRDKNAKVQSLATTIARLQEELETTKAIAQNIEDRLKEARANEARYLYLRNKRAVLLDTGFWGNVCDARTGEQRDAHIDAQLALSRSEEGR